jgi:HSP20 family protein
MLPVKREIDRRMISWDPFRELMRMQEDMDHAFASMWRLGNEDVKTGRPWVPSIEVHEDKNQFTVEAELPGITKENLSLNLADETLTISGERKTKREEKEGGTLFSEITYGSFQRVIPFGQPVKAEAVKAEFKDGILKVTLPKAEETKTKEIKIDVK